MAHQDTAHTIKELALDGVTFRLNFWPDENGGLPHSVVVVRSGYANTQTNITADEMRRLAALLQMQAHDLDEATAARETLRRRLDAIAG